MASDGKQLEGLVAFVERTLGGDGFAVTTNSDVVNEDGVRIAEFDVEIHGIIGSTEISWLIECRDRPSAGAAPGAWIEQLVGRRQRFNFNKVTAVSTSGFAAPAILFAKQVGIELREVKDLSPDSFSSWLGLDYWMEREHVHKVNAALIIINEAHPPEIRDALSAVLQGEDRRFLRAVKDGSLRTPDEAFLNCLRGEQEMFKELTPEGPPRHLRVRAEYLVDDYFVIDLPGGQTVRVVAIEFDGELFVRENKLPLVAAAEYRIVEDGRIVSQVATFAPTDIHGRKFALEIHKLAATGEQHVGLRCVK